MTTPQNQSAATIPFTAPETQSTQPAYAYTHIPSQQAAVSYANRPARRQVKKGSGPIRPEHASSDFNIWYHKKLGDRFEKEERSKATTRCCVATDAGYTKADKAVRHTWICLYFARGHCTNGAECNYYHRIPNEADELHLDMMHDVFGRERHRAYREDMTGTGSFTKENKTLFVGGVKRNTCNEEVLTRHFGEWGPLEQVRMIWDKSIGFIRYKMRSSAEFAKEAMNDQSMDDNEVLAVKWANEDPNPVAQQQEENKQALQLAAALYEKQKEEDPLYYYGAGNGQTMDENGQPTAVDTFPSQQYPSQYPNTDTQYASHSYGDSTKMVAEWLKKTGEQAKVKGLEDYTSDFLSAGYFDRQALSQLDDIGLDAVGVDKTDHRKALLNGVKTLAAELEQELLQQQQAYQQYYYGSYTANHDASANYAYTNEQYAYTNEEYNDTSVPEPVAASTVSKQANNNNNNNGKKSLVDYGSDSD